MNWGGLVGRAILVGLDALVAGVLVGTIVFFAEPLALVDDRLLAAATAAGLAFGATLAVAMALSRLGRQPFPATRTVRAVADRLPWWV